MKFYIGSGHLNFNCLIGRGRVFVGFNCDGTVCNLAPGY